MAGDDMAATDRKLTEPLWTVTSAFGVLNLGIFGLILVLSFVGSGSLGGFGRGARLVCATHPRALYSDDGAAHSGVAAQPGATIDIYGTLHACTVHPSFYQRLMYTLTSAPSALVWAAVLFLLWRLVLTARRSGPFTQPVAIGMRRLGWVVFVGTLAAASAQGAATDALLNTVLTPRNVFGDAVPDVTHILPVPLLVCAALLTFARIIRLGVTMDEDIQGTV